MMTHALQIQDLRKCYGGLEVLSGCSLEFEAGKVHALLGPNGVGKTTLLRILNLLEMPTGGAVRFNEFKEEGQDGNVIRREITMVFQRPALFKTTVYQNVAYGLKLRKVHREKIRERVGEVLDLVGMSGCAGREARTLSAGEAQRVALARALAVRPRILFLDEPTANLDPYNSRKVEEIILEIKSRDQTTILLATHNLFQAQRISDRVVFLYGGRVVESADTRTFFEHPKEELSRQFIRGEWI